MCHDFLRIFMNMKKPERARFMKYASHSTSYRALETGPNGLQKFEPAYQTRLHASSDACMASTEPALSPFMQNEEKSKKIMRIPPLQWLEGGAK